MLGITQTCNFYSVSYYADVRSKGLYLKPEPRQKTKTPRIEDIKKSKKVLGEQLCSCILFVHALLGCDTISPVHDSGKPAALKKILTSDHYSLALAQTMSSLDALCYSHFQEKVARSSKYVEAKNLPPTAAAMKYMYHTLSVFLQIELCKGNPGNL